MEKFNQSEYIQNYVKENYTNCNVRIKAAEAEKIEEYRQILGLSKNAFFIRCALYCAENDVRIEELPEIPPKKWVYILYTSQPFIYNTF